MIHVQEYQCIQRLSADDVPQAKQFYGETLGLNVAEEQR